jgi:hypothetical protein
VQKVCDYDHSWRVKIKDKRTESASGTVFHPDWWRRDGISAAPNIA